MKKMNQEQLEKWKQFKEVSKVIGEFEKALWLAKELSSVIPLSKTEPIINFLEKEYQNYRSIIYKENIDLNILEATKQELSTLEQDLEETKQFLLKRDKYLNEYVKMSIQMLEMLIKKRREVLNNDKK